ncbi:MAG TPA: hypothetical protein VF546_24290 [Pyrinomonadaceae bacterium]|jgi:hypothetical protein
MGEERINKIKIDDLPQPEQELTPEEAQNVKGGQGDAAARTEEQSQKRDSSLREQDTKAVGDSSLAERESAKKTA